MLLKTVDFGGSHMLVDYSSYGDIGQFMAPGRRRGRCWLEHRGGQNDIIHAFVPSHYIFMIVLREITKNN